MTLNIGDTAPDFTLPTDGEESITLSALQGNPVVVYFYPKDDTPGCTKEACEFRDNMARLQKNGVTIIGISKDKPTKHDKFKEKYDLNFPLASDEDCKICEAYGSWIEKSMYGRKYMGIDRSTFLVDSKGKLVQVWRKVKVTGHVDAVLNAIDELSNAQAA